MIPISDRPRAPRLFPLVMLTILAVNILVFLFVNLSLSPRQLQQVFLAYGVVPRELVTGHDLPPPSPHPLFLTIFTAMFLHGGFLHLASNMLYLWVFGDNVEAAMGHLRFLVFYLLCGLAAAITHILIDPMSTIPAIGASGAIAGVLAAYLRYYPLAGVKTLVFLFPFITVTEISAYLLIGLWFLLQLLSGLAELGGPPGQAGVAYWAHIGGFVAGYLLAPAFRRRRW